METKITYRQNPLNKFMDKKFIRSKTCQQIYKQFSIRKQIKKRNKSLSKTDKKTITNTSPHKKHKKRQHESAQTKLQKFPLNFSESKVMSKYQPSRIRYSNKNYQNKSQLKCSYFQNQQEQHPQNEKFFDISQINSQIITNLKMNNIILQQKLHLKDDEVQVLTENYLKLKEQYRRLINRQSIQKRQDLKQDNNCQRHGDTSPRFNTYLKQNQEHLKKIIQNKRGDIIKIFQELEERVSEQFSSQQLKNSNLVQFPKQKYFQSQKKQYNSSRFKPQIKNSSQTNNYNYDTSSTNHQNKMYKRTNASNYKPFSPIDIFSIPVPVSNQTDIKPSKDNEIYSIYQNQYTPSEISYKKTNNNNLSAQIVGSHRYTSASIGSTVPRDLRPPLPKAQKNEHQSQNLFQKALKSNKKRNISSINCLNINKFISQNDSALNQNFQQYFEYQKHKKDDKIVNDFILQSQIEEVKQNSKITN